MKGTYKFISEIVVTFIFLALSGLAGAWADYQVLLLRFVLEPHNYADIARFQTTLVTSQNGLTIFQLVLFIIMSSIAVIAIERSDF